MSQTTTSVELTNEPAGPKVAFPEQVSAEPQERNVAAKKGSTAVVFLSTTFVTGISSLLAGVVTVVLPKMVEDLDIPHSLMLWYVVPNLQAVHADHCVQAIVNIRPDLRLHSDSLGCNRRCPRKSLHVSIWLCASECIHVGLWSCSDSFSAPFLSCTCGYCDRVLPTDCSKSDHNVLSAWQTKNLGFCDDGRRSASGVLYRTRVRRCPR